MPTPPIIGRPGEYTRISQETEVRIPWLTYVLKSCVLMIVNTGLWIIGWLLWARAQAKAIGYWRWLLDRWWPWFALNWPWYTITLILCWIGPSALAYLYRLLVEQLAKNTPSYDNLDPRDGLWRPWERQWCEDEEEPAPEMEIPLVDVNLITTNPETGKPQIQLVQGLLNSPDARRFYRAVVDDRVTFAERSAMDYEISRKVFRECIRDVLRERGLATWKNRHFPNLGVNLTPAGLELLRARAYHSPTPNRASAVRYA